MSRFLTRIVALLLVPCLVADSVTASVFLPSTQIPHVSDLSFNQVRIEQEAFSLPQETSWHPLHIIPAGWFRRLLSSKAPSRHGADSPGQSRVSSSDLAFPEPANPVVNLLTRQYGVAVHAPSLTVNTRYDVPKSDWVMERTGQPEDGPVYPFENVPQLTLRYPMDQFPLLGRGEAGTNSVGTYLGFVQEYNFPVAIKLLPLGRPEELIKHEVMLAQVLGNLCKHPRFYGLIRLKDGRVAYAMQVVRIKDWHVKIRGNEQVRKMDEDTRRLAGVESAGYVLSVENELIGLDAGDASIVDPLQYDVYLRNHLPAAAPDETIPPGPERPGAARRDSKSEFGDQEPDEPPAAALPSLASGDRRVRFETLDDGKGHKLYRAHDENTHSYIDVIPELGNNLVALQVNIDGNLRNILDPRGIPILYPFANRIKDGKFTFQGIGHDLNALPTAKKDANGHIFHGLVDNKPWKFEKMGADREGVYVTSSYDHTTDPDMLKVFGPGKITVTYRLKGNRLTIDTLVENHGHHDMPMSLAYHPWIKLPEKPEDRAQVELQVPATQRWLTDSHLIPLRENGLVPVSGKYDLQNSRPLGDDTFDDVLTGLQRDSDGFSTSIIKVPAYGVRIRVRVSQGFKHQVVYAPKDPVLCLEPQTSATDAFNLRAHGSAEASPIILRPGERFKERMIIDASSLPSVWPAAAPPMRKLSELEMKPEVLQLIEDTVRKDGDRAMARLRKIYGYELFPIRDEKDAKQFEMNAANGNRLAEMARREGFAEPSDPSVDDNSVVNDEIRFVASELAKNIAVHARKPGILLVRAIWLGPELEGRKGIEIIAFDRGKGFKKGIAESMQEESTTRTDVPADEFHGMGLTSIQIISEKGNPGGLLVVSHGDREAYGLASEFFRNEPVVNGTLVQFLVFARPAAAPPKQPFSGNVTPDIAARTARSLPDSAIAEIREQVRQLREGGEYETAGLYLRKVVEEIDKLSDLAPHQIQNVLTVRAYIKQELGRQPSRKGRFHIFHGERKETGVKPVLSLVKPAAARSAAPPAAGQPDASSKDKESNGGLKNIVLALTAVGLLLTAQSAGALTAGLGTRVDGYPAFVIVGIILFAIWALLKDLKKIALDTVIGTSGILIGDWGTYKLWILTRGGASIFSPAVISPVLTIIGGTTLVILAFHVHDRKSKKLAAGKLRTTLESQKLKIAA